MNQADVLDIIREGLLVTIIVGGPLMVIALVVGLAISLFQALTQIQEMTLSFVPKIITLFVVIILALPFMIDVMQGFTNDVMSRIAQSGATGGG